MHRMNNIKFLLHLWLRVQVTLFPRCNIVPGKTRTSAVDKIWRMPIRVTVRLAPVLGGTANMFHILRRTNTEL